MRTAGGMTVPVREEVPVGLIGTAVPSDPMQTPFSGGVLRRMGSEQVHVVMVANGVGGGVIARGHRPRPTPFLHGCKINVELCAPTIREGGGLEQVLVPVGVPGSPRTTPTLQHAIKDIYQLEMGYWRIPRPSTIRRTPLRRSVKRERIGYGNRHHYRTDKCGNRSII